MSEDPRGYMPVAQRHDWATPPALFDALDQEFGPFDLDPCGQREHHYTAYTIHARGGLFYDGSCPAMDGLAQDWTCTAAFVNPPYGRELSKWVRKAVREVEAGRARRVVMLIPSRTDTKVWQECILREVGPRSAMHEIDAHHRIDTVRFLPGRVQFVGADGPAPFPSAIVVWTA